MTDDTTDDDSIEHEFTDLTGFQRDILLGLAQEGPNYGLGLKSWLEDHGYGEVNHGRLYPNLDDLPEDGYVSRSERDKRTNEYRLTSRGEELVNANRQAWDAAWTRTTQRDADQRGD